MSEGRSIGRAEIMKTPADAAAEASEVAAAKAAAAEAAAAEASAAEAAAAGTAAKAAADPPGARAALAPDLPKEPGGGAEGMAEAAEEIPGRPVFSAGGACPRPCGDGTVIFAAPRHWLRRGYRECLQPPTCANTR